MTEDSGGPTAGGGGGGGPSGMEEDKSGLADGAFMLETVGEWCWRMGVGYRVCRCSTESCGEIGAAKECVRSERTSEAEAGASAEGVEY